MDDTIMRNENATIGYSLQEARKRKDLTIEEVSFATHISKRYVEALENDDYSVFPAETYMIGFLRAYSQFLDLVPEVLIEHYYTLKNNNHVLPIDELIKQRRPVMVPIAIIVFLLLVIGGIIFFVGKAKVNSVIVLEADTKTEKLVTMDSDTDSVVMSYALDSARDEEIFTFANTQYRVSLVEEYGDEYENTVVLAINDEQYLFIDKSIQKISNSDQEVFIQLLKDDTTDTLALQFSSFDNRVENFESTPVYIADSPAEKFNLRLDIKPNTFVSYRIDNGENYERLHVNADSIQISAQDVKVGVSDTNRIIAHINNQKYQLFDREQLLGMQHIWINESDQIMMQSIV